MDSKTVIRVLKKNRQAIIYVSEYKDLINDLNDEYKNNPIRFRILSKYFVALYSDTNIFEKNDNT